MPSTYSPSLRIELPGSGEQSGVWGTTTNNNLGTLLEQSIAGVQAITMSDANYTLSNYNGVSDEARKAVLVVSGTNTAARDIIAPLVSKVYTIKNNTIGGFAINIRASSGASVSIANGATVTVYCDGTNFNAATFALNASNTYTVAGLTATGQIAATSPNSGSAGALQLRNAVGNPDTLYLQAVNNANNVQYSTLQFKTNGTIIASGKFSATNYNNLYIGIGAGSATNNIAIGQNALISNTSGLENTAIGQNALQHNTTGQYNLAIGASSLSTTTTGSYNTAVGGGGALQYASGSNNTAIGTSALYTQLSGDYNVGIGNAVTASSTSVSNEVSIWNGVQMARFQGAASSWSFVSDVRDKTNVEDLTIGLEFINELQPRKFEWDIRNCEVDKGKKASGFIAQEVLEVMKICDADYTGLVNTNNPDQYTLAQTNLIPIMVNAIKELTARLELLEAK